MSKPTKPTSAESRFAAKLGEGMRALPKIPSTFMADEGKSAYAAAQAREEHEVLRQKQVWSLFTAAYAKDYVRLDRLIEAGAPINLPLAMGSAKYALPEAQRFRRPGMSDDTVHAGAHLTLLGWSAARGDEEMVNWCISHGADPAMSWDGGRDAAWEAMAQGHEAIALMLLDRAGRLNTVLKMAPRFNRLQGAVEAKSVSVVDYLVRKKVGLDHRDASGRTALHLALAHNPFDDRDREICLLLLMAGVSPNEQDNESVRAHQYAETEEAKMVLEGYVLDHPEDQDAWLLDAGLSPSVPAPGVKPKPLDPEAPAPPAFDDPTLPPQISKPPPRPLKPKARGH